MKQLLSLFLFLLPCLAWAQYPSNGNQKITLGEQTTADGLIFRGVASIDTVTATSKITRANKQDTSAFVLLDTTTNLLWHYKTSSNGWIQAGGGTSVTTFSGGTTGLTPSTATSGAVTLGGTLAVANGGTNRTTMPAGYILHGDGTSVDTSSGLFWDRTNRRLGIGTINPGVDFEVFNSVNQPQFVAYNGTNWITLRGDAPLIGRTSGKDLLFVTYSTYPTTGASVQMNLQSNGKLKIADLAGINDIGADADGVLQAATSDMNLKNTIENSPFGLNEILLLNPVTFLYNDINRKLDSNVKEVGFIAQDVFDIIPNAVSSTGTGDLQLDYRAITATLTKAIQEQQAQIEALKQRLLILENK